MEALEKLEVKEFGGRVWKPREPRYRIDAEARVLLEDGTSIPFKLYDISVTGAWLETPYLLDVGEKIWLSIIVPGVPGEITLRGVVVRVSDKTPEKPWGMGIKFIINERERERLRKLIELFGY